MAIYLTNKELLSAIHESKTTFCSFLDDRYRDYDGIVSNVQQVTERLIGELKITKAKKMEEADFQAQKRAGKKNIQRIGVDPSSIPDEDVVVRVMTFEHIPARAVPITVRREKDRYELCNFPPFQHVILRDGEVVCVGKSHWVGGVSNGHFSTDHGRVTERLGAMWMLLAERYSGKMNWRGYSYRDEMVGNAIIQFTHSGLYFDESKSSNPFAYYTQLMKNTFTRVLNTEKKNQRIRDELLIMNGEDPSFARQVENEMEYRAMDN